MQKKVAYKEADWYNYKEHGGEGMYLYAPFEPRNLIQSIECARTTGRSLTAQEISVLKEKLYTAEENQLLIRLARGDGRANILNQIIADDRVIFGWGIKSQHAFHEQSKLRDFLEPNQVDVEQMVRIVELYQHNLTYQFTKKLYANARCFDNIKQLCDAIYKYQHSREALLLIKDWICTVLHTSGCADFKNISPWVSASTGASRYKTAYDFGAGVRGYGGRRTGTNHRFVIFDTWVFAAEEHMTFERTQFLIERFREMGLPWYPDRHHEIMLKYAIYPQNLIGYYYFENDCLLYYYVNPHYLEYMYSSPQFQIGDSVFIDQSDVQFPAENPYRIIYSRDGSQFDVFKRR